MKSEWKVTSTALAENGFMVYTGCGTAKRLTTAATVKPRISSFLMRLKTCLGENLTRKTKPRPRRSHDC